MIFAKFLLFTKGQHSVQTGGSLESDTKINSVVRREIDGFGRPTTQKSPPTMKIF